MNRESPISRRLRCVVDSLFIRRSSEDGCVCFVLVCRPKLRSFIAVSAMRRRVEDIGRRARSVHGTDSWDSSLVTSKSVKDTRRSCSDGFVDNFSRFVGQDLVWYQSKAGFSAQDSTL